MAALANCSTRRTVMWMTRILIAAVNFLEIFPTARGRVCGGENAVRSV